MTDTTLLSYCGLAASVRLIQDGPQSYRVEVYYSEAKNADHNLVACYNVFPSAHRYYRECVQRCLFIEERYPDADIDECADAFRELWEEDDKGRGQHIRNLIAEQIAAQ